MDLAKLQRQVQLSRDARQNPEKMTVAELVAAEKLSSHYDHGDELFVKNLAKKGLNFKGFQGDKAGKTQDLVYYVCFLIS